MNLSEEDILSVSSFFLRFSCRLIVLFIFVFCFASLSFFVCLFVCLFVILLKKRENGRAIQSRRHSENRALYFDILKIQQDSEAQRTRTKEMNKDGRLISFDCFLLALLPS